MARKREHNVDIPNLYCKLDKRTGKVYWQYYHQGKGRFIGFGTNAGDAKAAATELNRIIAEQRNAQINALIQLAMNDKKPELKVGGLTVKQWIIQYKEIQNKRLDRGELKSTTVRYRLSCAEILKGRLRDTPLDKTGAREMAAILNEYIDRGKVRMAQLTRGVWIDIFKEAQYAGEVPPGFNPALATKAVSAKVKRSRLDLKNWESILKLAMDKEPYVKNSLLLGIVTGQRIGDVVAMKFSDIRDGLLYVQQEKRGKKLAIPLTLKCNAINFTLEEVIKGCHDDVESPYLVHHIKSHRSIKAGGKLHRTTVSKAFAELRDMANIQVPKGKTPPTFHELRSLAGRLYKSQGIDTQKLLGHTRAEMTERYLNERNDDWDILTV